MTTTFNAVVTNPNTGEQFTVTLSICPTCNGLFANQEAHEKHSPWHNKG